MPVPLPSDVNELLPERDENVRWQEIDEEALFKDTPGQYTDYVINNHYFRDGHVYQMGLTSPKSFKGASCAFVQLAAATLIWVADWTASRTGLPPEIPSPSLLLTIIRQASAALGFEQWILLDENVETAGITELEADGVTTDYRISGTYVYGCTNPQIELVKHLVFGLAPYIGQDGTLHRRVPDRTFLRSDIIYTPGNR